METQGYINKILELLSKKAAAAAAAVQHEPENNSQNIPVQSKAKGKKTNACDCHEKYSYKPVELLTAFSPRPKIKLLTFDDITPRGWLKNAKIFLYNFIKIKPYFISISKQF